jgi:hypothetical protein
MATAKILIVEDDLNLLSTLKYNLVKEGVTYRIGGRALDRKPVVSSEAMVDSCGGAQWTEQRTFSLAFSLAT